MKHVKTMPGMMMRWLAVLAMLFAGISQADDTIYLQFDKGKTSELRLAIGKSQIIQSRSALDQVVIGNPEIADIKLLTSTQVLILGMSPGRTNLVFRDKQKNLIAVMDVVVGYDLSGIKRKIAELLPDEENIEVRDSNHSVILSGRVQSIVAMDRALNVARSYVPAKNVINSLEVAGGQQVMLEVRMAEVSRRSLKQLGVTMDFSNASSNPWTVVTGSSLNNPFAVIGGTRFKGIKTLSGTIEALEKEGLAKTLAEPNLVALSGQEASFLAGGEIPIPVAQAGTALAGTITIEYKEFGIGLKFTPTVLGNDKINIKLSTEVSAIDTSNTLSTGFVDVPTLLTRRAGTTIEMADGQGFAIAGLMESTMNNAIDRFPVLGSIPVLGALFRSNDYQRNETELVIVVTPRLVKPVDPDQLRLVTDNLVPPDSLDQYLMGFLEHKWGRSHEKNRSDQDSSKSEPGLEGDYGHQLNAEKTP
ncbi:MAG TPA: type II and III secretion system protein family protein [Pseudomonadales bacterium]